MRILRFFNNIYDFYEKRFSNIKEPSSEKKLPIIFKNLYLLKKTIVFEKNLRRNLNLLTLYDINEIT
jgi:hypothetical protein